MTSSAEAALERIQSSSLSERLIAARYLAIYAEAEHLPVIRRAIAKENVSWVKRALEEALLRCQVENAAVSDEEAQPIPGEVLDQLNSRALETTTAQIIHEIEPLIGRLKLAASEELSNYETSHTARAIERIDSFLAALARLRKAASAPKLDEFSLDELVHDVVRDNQNSDRVVFQVSGPEHCIVVGDRSLIQMCVSNGLRNAIEATEALEDKKAHPILVTWSSTDVNNWVSIVDVGIGFRGNIQRAMDIGTTTKSGHLGMGLAIVSQSIASMSGLLLLVPNTRGVRFEVQWPKTLGGQ